MITWWSLPGPSAIVETVAADVRAGKSVVIRRQPPVVNGLRAAIRSATSEDRIWVAVRPRTDLDPASALADALEILPPSLRPTAYRLAESEQLRNTTIWAEVSSDQTWIEFTRAFSRASERIDEFDRPIIIVAMFMASGCDLTSDVAMREHQLTGYSDRSDVEFYAQAKLRTAIVHRVTRQLVCSTIATVALWDVAFADFMIARWQRVLSDCSELVAEYGRSIPPIHASELASTPIAFEESYQFHSIALGDSSELMRRLWIAQASVLLPYIEDRRQWLIAKYRDLFPDPHVAFELEIAELADVLARAARVRIDDVRLAGDLRSVRNSVAHLELVPVWLLRRIGIGI